MLFKTVTTPAWFTLQQSFRADPLPCATGMRLGRVGGGAVAAVLAVSVVFRFLWLDRLPGINGDEAWYGVQVLRFLDGKSWSALTPSKLPINPLLFVTEATLLSLLEPSFWVLRLPVALWACVGLALTFVLHRWVFRDSDEALLVTALTACLPLHLAYSRFCWDSSFGFVSLPLVLYPLLKLLDRLSVRLAGELFALGASLTVAAHVTNVVFLAACLIVLLWGFRGEIWSLVQRKPATAVCLAVALTMLVPIGARKVRHPLRRIAESAGCTLEELPQQLEAWGDVLLGPRAYEYLAGVPHPSWTRWAYPMLLLAAAIVVGLLWRHGQCRDRTLILLAGATGTLMLVVAHTLSLAQLSYERYALYWLPLATVLFVRGVRTCAARLAPRINRLPIALTIACAMGFLAQYWMNYFESPQHLTQQTELHRTFKTGLREPKAAAATAIQQRSDLRGRPVVFTEDWWVQHAVDYLLGARSEVCRGFDPARRAGKVFAVGFAGSSFLERVRSADWVRTRSVEELQFCGAEARPILVVLVVAEED